MKAKQNSPFNIEFFIDNDVSAVQVNVS